MSRSGYKPLHQESEKDNLLDDILNDFDPASYFDDWFDEPAATSYQNAAEPSSSVKVAVPSPSNPASYETEGDLMRFRSDETVAVREQDARQMEPPQENPENAIPNQIPAENKGSAIVYSDPPSDFVRYGDESLGYRDPTPTSAGALPLPYEEGEEELSYDHYELVQAGVEPCSFSQRYPRQRSLEDSGVVMDVAETSPYLSKLDQDIFSDDEISPKMSKQSFEKAMSDEEAAKKARYCLICMKTYCVIFILTIVSLSIYVAADLSEITTDARVAKKETEADAETSQGYKELRLGGRRVFYRIKEPEEMANHTVLLIHGESQSGEMFKKLGTLPFLSTHGARAVAIDIIGYGRSDPPIHIPDTYEKFFTEIVSLFELEYNLVLVCVEEGCEKVLSYYLNHGVYRQDNSFIEGAVFVSPRGTTYSNLVQPEKSYLNTATRTLVVNGGKDEYLNMEVTKQLRLIPRCEVHPLPDLKNNFYANKHSKLYFHAALQAFMEGLAYEYDKELENLSAQHGQQSADNPNLGNMNYQNGQNIQQMNQMPQSQGGDAFSRFQGKQNSQGSTFQDLGYNPAHRFSKIKGRRKK